MEVEKHYPGPKTNDGRQHNYALASSCFKLAIALAGFNPLGQVF